MLKKIIKSYYKLLDEKLHNGTIIVIIIAFLIISVGNITNQNKSTINLKANIVEAQNTIEYIEINGKIYKLLD